VTLACRVCGRDYSLERFAEELDDEFERQFANVRCDRL
jgi:hypothetical protein